MSSWRMALLLLAGVSYAGFSHWLMVYHASAPWAVVALLGPLWLTGVGLSANRWGSRGILVSATLGVSLVTLTLYAAEGDPNLLYVFQHGAINGLLCAWFGASLRRDRLSLIGQFAERVHPLSPAMRIYTLQVTRVWTAYFALIVLASIVVYATLPFAAWSLLANVITPLLVGVLFVGEYLVRYRLHPEFERTPLSASFRAIYSGPIDRSAGQ